ncbi:ArsR family transcriptional regulator [Saccharomonospora amisosensis]|uniref:ArsR family transcriptional regulator n=2 Tax=Saccharomonospora amisosensis TaxID=1128677 RepID=A0A7X5ZRR0_9PSEU|nr:ArsR family transcriptional regulator [Saccharomonospora amisosensis]
MVEHIPNRCFTTRLEIDMATVGSQAPSALPGGPEGHEHSPARQPPAAVPAPPTATLAASGELLRALAAPVRIAIVLQLRAGERCVHELVDALDVTQPLISQHLRVLKAAGVVRGERRGREVVYHLVDDHLAHIVVDAVAHVQEGARNE